MHVTYADAALIGEVGHHANSCRMITAALRERGHEVRVAAAMGIDPALAQELGAEAHFRLNTYWGGDGDPVCGWLNAFFTIANVTAEDFSRLGPFGPDHILYVNSILPGQLMALRSLLLGLSDSERPQVFAELGTGPGLDYVEDESGARFVVRDTRIDPRATLYRFAARQIAAAPPPQLRLCTFDRTSSEVYAMLLELPVATLPVPHFAAVTPRLRDGTRPLTIGVLGHQRGEKGFFLVPAIVDLLLRRRGDVSFLVHNAQPTHMAETQARMRALADGEPRITLDELPAGPERWHALLDRCDLILCPYSPVQFRAAYSAVASEAIAHAIPLVVPAHTTMARLVDEFGNPGVTFPDQSVEAIAAAVEEAVERFDDLAARAMAAAQSWRTSMGAGCTVDAMLAQAAGGDMMARMMQRSRSAQPVKELA